MFVGDTVWDAQASQKAGVPCIGLLSGGIGREELADADAGAAQVYAGPGDLLARLPDSLIGQPAGALGKSVVHVPERLATSRPWRRWRRR